MPVKLLFRIMPPFSGELDMKGTVGCEGGMPNSFRFHNTSQRIEEAYLRILAARRSNTLTKDELTHFPRDILGLAETVEASAKV